jgi:predicted nuclease with TOPRIM domain
MNELLDQISKKYEELQKTIGSQRKMISAMKLEKDKLEQKIAEQRGQIMELEGKWSRMQKLLERAEGPR